MGIKSKVKYEMIMEKGWDNFLGILRTTHNG